MQQPRSGLIEGESRKSLSAHSNFPVPWPDSWSASQRSTERQALEACWVLIESAVANRYGLHNRLTSSLVHVKTPLFDIDDVIRIVINDVSTIELNLPTILIPIYSYRVGKQDKVQIFYF